MTTVRRVGIPAMSNGGGSLSQGRKNVLDLDDFSREEIEGVLQNATAMREVLQRSIRKVPALRGHTIITLFHEPSTRTRVSFEQAGKVLSADVINVTSTGSSTKKGESLYNTALTLQAMNADIIVMRHPHSGAPHFLARHLNSCVINAGDGAHAHPSQALLDMYTIKEKLGGIEGKKVAIAGDILYSRVGRSNLWGLLTMGAQVTLCAPPTLLPPDFLRPLPEEHPFASVRVTHRVEEALEGADVVMVKPALAYLDVIAAARAAFDVPIAAYNVSGEFGMITAAAERGWVDREKAIMETLTSIKRAGADMILTYFAKEVALMLK